MSDNKVSKNVKSIVSACEARAIAAPVQAAFWSREAKAWDAHKVGALLAAEVDCAALAKMIHNSDAHAGAGFLAKYAAEKVRKVADALAQGSLLRADRYTQSIALNSRALERLSAKGALVALSRSIEWTETDAQQPVKRYGNCTVGTASTQRSSTREALRALGIASVEKGKRDDVIAFSDTPAARAFVAIVDAALTK